MSDAISFYKWQGTGNDFILVDATLGAPGELGVWTRAARALCDRHFGIGADGILVLSEAQGADFAMAVVNADGSVAEMCGNGLRCAAGYWAERHGATGSLRVETGAGRLTAQVGPEGRIQVDMGLPRFAPAEIPIAGASAPDALAERLDPLDLIVSCVSMGNPHAVAFVADLDGLDLATLGPAVSGHQRFAAGANAGFAQVLGSHELRLWVWERGSGPTLACGTGACAAVVAGIATGRLESPVVAHLPGGDLEIAWAPGSPVLMTGPALPVFDGWLEPSRIMGGFPALS